MLTSAQKEKVGVECANDVIAFSKRPYMLGIESISNNGKHLSALLKTEQCTMENTLQYQTYINQYLDDCKHKFGDFSKLSFEKLSDITEKVLKEATNYGYKYYAKRK